MNGWWREPAFWTGGRARINTLKNFRMVCKLLLKTQLQAAHPDQYYGVPFGTPNPERPGLHASCLPFLRDHDIAVLIWDMMDYMPNGYDIPWSVHGAIFAYGIALLDNALLQPLAEVCAQEGRYEFMLIIAPLKVIGGTGSPANSIALF